MKNAFALAVSTALVFALTGCEGSVADVELPEGDSVGETIEPTTRDVSGAAPSAEPASGVTDSQSAVIDQTIDLLKDGERITKPGISFVVPEGWTLGGDRAMRLFTLLPPAGVSTGDLAVNQWPGNIGGFGPNVTRWARQAGVTPPSLKREDYPQVEISGTPSAWITLVDEGKPSAILAVWVPLGEDPDNPTSTWTFKLTCPPGDVEKLEPAVRAWAESIKFE